ncbi:DUF4468 domain-containing protein [Chitinophagaceae bacterium MMS25-I14]
MKVLLFFAGLFFSAIVVNAQAPLSSILVKDTANHYYFMRQISTGKSKSVVYNKVKEWVKASLDPADNYLLTDDSGNDSIRTLAFITIDDLPQVQNQVISYKLLLQFNEGNVNVYADGFIYQGDNKSNGDSYDLPLGNMKNIDPATQPAVIYAFDKKFERLINSLERTVR